MKICNYRYCRKEFNPDDHRQLYCHDDCKKLERNIKSREDRSTYQAEKRKVVKVDERFLVRGEISGQMFSFGGYR